MQLGRRAVLAWLAKAGALLVGGGTFLGRRPAARAATRLALRAVGAADGAAPAGDHGVVGVRRRRVLRQVRHVVADVGG